jgi:hypothetical protein
MNLATRATVADPVVAPVPAANESTWVSASRELRSTAKWVITALAAVATVVFGAGPVITRPSLDFEGAVGQLSLAFALGVAGLIGIGLLILSVSKVLLPIEMSLDELPQELGDKIEKTPASILPGGVSTLRQFRDTLASLRTAVVEIPGKVEDYKQAAHDAQLAGDSAAFHEAEAAAAAYEAAYNDALANLVTYEAVGADLVDRGAFAKLSRVFSDQSTRLWVGALLAGIGGLGFQLALTSVPDSGDPDPSASSAGPIAMLSPGERASDFWNTYGLAGCETSDGQVPVLLTGGEGTESSPYTVQTIPDRTGPDSTCPAVSFSAFPELFSVVVPEPDEVTIEFDRADG